MLLLSSKNVDITLLVVLAEISLCCGYPSPNLLKQRELQYYQGNLMKLSGVESNKLKKLPRMFGLRRSFYNVDMGQTDRFSLRLWAFLLPSRGRLRRARRRRLP